MWQGVIAQYRSYLPVSDDTPVITLLEGGTPLLESRLGDPYGLRVLLKYEGTNPTGSFKDRGMTVAVSKAKEEQARGIICASTGNTGASAAAYGARAGLPCILVVPASGVSREKLTQAVACGAVIVPVDTGFDHAFHLTRMAAREFALTTVNSINPYRLAGQKTAAFEICDVLGRAPQSLAIPVGNAGNISAYWMGFKEYQTAGRIDRLPQLIGVQAAGAAPLVLGRPVDDPHTMASAIRIGRPASWHTAVQAVTESSGLFISVTDDEIAEAQLQLGREGLFVEPASAAAVAGLLKLATERRAPPEAVCVLTGHGLKDPTTVWRSVELPLPQPATLDAIAEQLRASTSLGR